MKRTNLYFVLVVGVFISKGLCETTIRSLEDGGDSNSDSSQSEETSQESNDFLAKPKDVIGTIVQLKKIADVIGSVGQKVIPAIIDAQTKKSILPTDNSAITPLKLLQSIKQNNE